MKILVYDVAAEDGGGIFVLKSFYKEVLAYNNPDIEWIFMVSTPEIAATEKIKVLYYPHIKQSWGKRLKFEYIMLPKIIREMSPDLIISLQNMPAMRCDVRQFVYLHQSLQYCQKRFSLFKNDERGLAIRQRFISMLIKISMPKAEHIFVQTQWIKDATIKWLKCDEKIVSIVPVSVNTDGIEIKEYIGFNSRAFFYPARAELYKNHSLIIEACRILNRKGIDDYQVILTMRPDENLYAKRIAENAQGLPITYTGALPYKEIWETYSRTILLFPSYLETCGLPMLEARKAGAVILASDTPFSHEALAGYPNAHFFSINSAEQLADAMINVLNNSDYQKWYNDKPHKESSLLNSMLEKI